MSKEFYFLLAIATTPRVGNLAVLPPVGMTLMHAVTVETATVPWLELGRHMGFLHTIIPFFQTPY